MNEFRRHPELTVDDQVVQCSETLGITGKFMSGVKSGRAEDLNKVSNSLF